MIGEHTTGQSRLDYLCDALGSVVATVDQTQTVKSTARYKPYGADLATTGTQPLYGWVGSLGYRKTSIPHVEIYARARHYGVTESRWLSSDPLWPTEPSYTYCLGSPTNLVDSDGMAACFKGRPCRGTELTQCENQCNSRHLEFLDCNVTYSPGVNVNCSCKCPDPPVNTSGALVDSLRTLPSTHKGWVCNQTGVGDEKKSTKWPGCTHQTYKITCKKGRSEQLYTVSNICCPCTGPSGGSLNTCFSVITAK